MYQICTHCGNVSEDWGMTEYEGAPAEFCYECGGIDSMEPCEPPVDEDNEAWEAELDRMEEEYE